MKAFVEGVDYLRFPYNRVSFASIFWDSGDYTNDYTETKLHREFIPN